MNGKQAKMIRRRAEELTEGMPQVEYKEKIVSKVNAFSNALFGGQCSLIDACTRKFYKSLKREYLRGNFV